MVELPTPVPVTVTEQVVPAKVQAMEEKETLPVPPDCDQVIVSPDIEPELPETVAVQEVDEPTATEEDVHVARVVVGATDTVTEVEALAVWPSDC